MHDDYNRVRILGVPFDKVVMKEALLRAGEMLRDGKQHMIVTPNPEICLLARKDKAYRLILENAELSIADGFGILWAARFLDGSRNIFRFVWTYFTTAITRRVSPLPERVTGTDFMISFCKRANKKKVFLLGASDKVNARTREILESRFGSNVVGNFSGSPQEEEETEIVRLINESGAEVLFVAFGAPRQEKWIARNLGKMKQVRLAVGIGGAFDFIVGQRKRAPKWMRDFGLEWLYRVVIEPRRIGRILNAMVVFPLRVLTS
jgi:N-acetylglucosaminyldiphosphoundecaprenol N-acetyl-beta-D-mannosaminyltransferase